MADKPKKLSDTARALLSVAATRGDHLIRPPKLPIAAARQVFRSLLNAGLVEEVPVPINDPGCGWRTGEGGGVLALRATALRMPASLDTAAQISDLALDSGTAELPRDDSRL
jgi:hypothetical protein